MLTLHARAQVLEGEKGVKCYGLAKTMSDNFKYVGYEGAPSSWVCNPACTEPWLTPVAQRILLAQIFLQEDSALALVIGCQRPRAVCITSRGVMQHRAMAGLTLLALTRRVGEQAGAARAHQERQLQGVLQLRPRKQRPDAAGHGDPHRVEGAARVEAGGAFRLTACMQFAGSAAGGVSACCLRHWYDEQVEHTRRGHAVATVNDSRSPAQSSRTCWSYGNLCRLVPYDTEL